MHTRLEVRSGARAGLVLPLLGPHVRIGRHPDAELRFSPDADLEVSAQHALLLRQGGQWLLRDLGSRNGTFLNGERVEADRPLRDGDRIGFGAGGPVVVFRDPAAAPAPAAPAELSHTTQLRVRREVARQTRWLRNAALGMGAALLLMLALALAVTRARQSAWQQERAALQARTDSALRAGDASVRALQGELHELAGALRSSQRQVRTLSAQLERARGTGDTARLPALRQRLLSATTTLERQRAAASVDFRGIERRNGPAVALLYVETPAGQVATGTAFAVRPDALLLTSRHVVAGPEGTERPRRLGVQFARSEQVWPARLLALSREADLALLKVDNIEGEVPTVAPLNLRADTLAAGAPLVMLGFPAGGEAADGGSGAGGAGRAIPRPLLSVGLLAGAAGGGLEIRGYGAMGASGSPVFDAEGRVIAVVFGGRGVATVFAVPAAAAARLIAQAP